MNFQEARGIGLRAVRAVTLWADYDARPDGYEDPVTFRVVAGPPDWVNGVEATPEPMDLPIVLVDKATGAVSILPPMAAMAVSEGMSPVQ